MTNITVRMIFIHIQESYYKLDDRLFNRPSVSIDKEFSHNPN